MEKVQILYPELRKYLYGSSVYPIILRRYQEAPEHENEAEEDKKRTNQENSGEIPFLLDFHRQVNHTVISREFKRIIAGFPQNKLPGRLE
jgi:hypothetical protein